ncbi:streptomycin adenylyltransferase [Leptospira ellinghausenii]|uniref:Streptomycin adenylyltransferase n=1 Tax=Leptospira ellinghausenii TaxID=1917822 RepID=A0A2P2DF52_9LEPT|nr:aminoglycoside 6-adenylyltransferase [Leptospira ellinghausenii]GBF43229.1 streptomycin adenylyltransferase [Leptospira ellinghausenii]
MNVFKKYLETLIEIVKSDARFTAVCCAGSAITGELDQFSDLDIFLITENNIVFSHDEMKRFAYQVGDLLVGFTGEHVGESRLLICLYNSPLLHVDLKFIEIQEFTKRVENPIVVYDRKDQIPEIYKNSKPIWPNINFQWIEDRFWVWIHYAATKLGRGELFEAIDFLSFLRNQVLGPMFHLKYEKNPRGVRKLEFILSNADLEKLKTTIPIYDYNSIFHSIFASINLYCELRNLLATNLNKQEVAEKESVQYLNHLKQNPNF